MQARGNPAGALDPSTEEVPQAATKIGYDSLAKVGLRLAVVVGRLGARRAKGSQNFARVCAVLQRDLDRVAGVVQEPGGPVTDRTDRQSVEASRPAATTVPIAPSLIRRVPPKSLHHIVSPQIRREVTSNDGPSPVSIKQLVARTERQRLRLPSVETGDVARNLARLAERRRAYDSLEFGITNDGIAQEALQAAEQAKWVKWGAHTTLVERSVYQCDRNWTDFLAFGPQSERPEAGQPCLSVHGVGGFIVVTAKVPMEIDERQASLPRSRQVARHEVGVRAAVAEAFLGLFNDPVAFSHVEARV
jgi:hypothetical protein